MVQWKEKISPEKAFNELINFKIIDRNRMLVRSKFFEPRASFFKGKIYYPTRIIKTTRERAYFVFLHEEFHSSNFSWQRTGVIFSIIIGLIASFISLLYLQDFYAPGVAFVFIFLSVRSFIPLMKKEEYDADKFSSDTLRRLNNKKPSKIFKEIFFPKKVVMQEKSFKFYFWKVAEKLLPYHPKDIDRYNKLKEYERK